MKNIIVIHFLFFYIFSYSQTSLDYLLFKKVNKYRTENNLKKWKWSNRAFKPAIHHSKYQASNGYMGHDEQSNTPRPTSRLDLYNIDWKYSGENCAVICATNRTDEYISSHILELWIKSPAHNDLLLNPHDGRFGAISCRYSRHYKWSHDSEDWIFCTLTVFRESYSDTANN